MTNSTFIAFKPSGKYYSKGRGHFPKDPATKEKWLFDHKEIAEANGGDCPGLSGPGESFTIIVIPDDDCDLKWAWPRRVKHKLEE